jgi:hypothetical protein
MQFTQTVVAALLACSAAVAAPVATEKSMMVADAQWTIQSMKRWCNSDNSSCTWLFGIYPGSGTATTCRFVVNGSPASQINGGPAQCGDYTITTGWSGQFGPHNGFTTLSVVNNVNRQIIWPAYTDNQLQNSVIVTPDQSYTPAALP